jgi:hypothetical protein
MDRDQVRGEWSEIRKFTIRGGAQPGGPNTKGPPPPTIEIADMVDLGDRVIVVGKTQQYVTLEAYLNGHKYDDVSVDEKGEFRALVSLEKEGKNSIEIVAHDTYGQETRVEKQAYFQPD